MSVIDNYVLDMRRRGLADGTIYKRQRCIELLARKHDLTTVSAEEIQVFLDTRTAMRKWILIGALVVAGCGSDKTATFAARTTTAPVEAAAVATTTAPPTTTLRATTLAPTTTVKPFSEYRDDLIKLIEGIGDRVDTIEMVPDGARQVLRINYTSSYSTADYLSHQGWDVATKLAPLWDGDETNGSGLNLDLTVSDDKHKLVYHYVCKGEVMDKVKSRRIVEADWVAACKA